MGKADTSNLMMTIRWVIDISSRSLKMNRPVNAYSHTYCEEHKDGNHGIAENEIFLSDIMYVVFQRQYHSSNWCVFLASFSKCIYCMVVYSMSIISHWHQWQQTQNSGQRDTVEKTERSYSYCWYWCDTKIGGIGNNQQHFWSHSIEWIFIMILADCIKEPKFSSYTRSLMVQKLWVL